MKRSLLVFSLAALACGAGAGAAACSGGSSGTQPAPDAAAESAPAEGSSGGVSFTPVNPCTDSDDAIYANPGDVSSAAKGDILKCAHDPDLSIADLNAAVDVSNDAGDQAYSGEPFTSGAHVYRVLYRTERGDANGSPGYASALVLLPDTPRAASTPLPVVVAAHGSRGQASKCAPSKNDPAASYVEEDFQHQVYPLVGLGYAVIAPDLAGYANYGGTNNPPSAYDGIADVAKSMIDGARALRKLIPSAMSQQIVLVGHSQGGYTALGTLAYSSTYPPDATIAAVAVYAPIWLSQRVWAALLFAPASYGFAQSSAGEVSIWYHYTHGELLDGPGHGLDLFQDSKKAVVKSFIDNDCWSPGYPDLYDAGASANDFFLPSYVSAIATAATPLGNGNCNGNTTCQTWIDRMTADWPHLTGSTLNVPILIYYANADGTVTPDAMQCVLNRLTGDQASYQICYDTNPVGHGGVVAENASYVADWIAQKAMNGPAPSGGHCSALAPNDAGVPQIVDEAGSPIQCNQLISSQ
jgi:pimeloyl-ACP methyl ester carboxylesterase